MNDPIEALESELEVARMNLATIEAERDNWKFTYEACAKERDALAARVTEAEMIIEGWIMSPQTTQATWDAIRELGKWFVEAPNK